MHTRPIPETGEARPEPRPRPARIEWGSLLVGLLLLASLAAWVVLSLSPPAVVARTAAPDVFSAERARVHVERIAAVPHPSGSPAGRAVEAYLVATLEALGLRVEIQAAPACTEAAGLRRCGHLRNVIATLPGRTHDDAILLSAHHDSVPNAPGAGDDASGVAALLEVARALSRSGPLDRDVLFALLDGEEDMMLGSVAFCREPRLTSRVRLALNFDARGSRGAVTLIGASDRAGAVIDALAEVLPHPVLSSFYPSIARALPNATDADVYERCGLNVLSFAFADGFENYHRGTDDPAHLDDRSVQHEGEYALALARRFGTGDLDVLRRPEGDRVYFDVGATWVVRYSYPVARWLALALAVAAAALVFTSLRAGRVRAATLARDIAVYVASLIVAAVAGALLVGVATPGWGFWSAYRHADALTGIAACFIVAGYVLLTAFARQRADGDVDERHALAPLLVWVTLAILSALLLPGLSHIFTWPAVGVLAAQALAGRIPVRAGLVQYAALVPAVLLITPVIYTLVVVIGAPGVSGAMLCVALVLGASSVPVRLLATRARLVASLLVLVGTSAALWLNLRVRSEQAPPIGNLVGYAVDSEAGSARWISSDAFQDDHKSQFLGDSPERARLPMLPSTEPVLMNAAPFVALEPPELELLSDAWLEGERHISLRVRSRRAARTVQVWETTGAAIDTWLFDGSPPFPIVRFTPELDRKLLHLLSGLGGDERWSVTLFSTQPEGSSLVLSTQHAGPLELRSIDRSEGLARVPAGLIPRSEAYTMGYPGDHTLVSGARLLIPALPRGH